MVIAFFYPIQVLDWERLYIRLMLDSIGQVKWLLMIVVALAITISMQINIMTLWTLEVTYIQDAQ